MSAGQTESVQGPTYRRVQRALEWPMMVLALLFVAAMVLQDTATVPAPWRETARVADWVIWAAFVGEYLTLLALARDRKAFVRGHLLDLVVLALPALRVLRLVRVLRMAALVRLSTAVALALRQWLVIRGTSRSHKLSLLAAASVLVLLVSAYLMYMTEGQANAGFASYGLSLWWALATTTSATCSEAVPHTTCGRVIACAFAFVGIAAFGLVSAAIAAHFVEQDSKDEWKRVEARLEEVNEVLRDVWAKLAASEAETDRDGTRPTGT